jgi:hypothetical protein
VKVVHCKLGEPFDQYIGRPSKWGNPFTVEKHGRGKAISLFAEKVLADASYQAATKVLAGKTLACWCAPKGGLEIDGKLLCHGQILLRAARGDYDDVV